MIGGKVKAGETHIEAAFREFEEETSLKPVRAWVLPTINTFYDPKADQIRYIPAFAFECATGAVRLNHEHDMYAWLNAEDAIQRLGWHEQKRILQIAHDIITSNSVLAEWQLPV
jgi:8-oxo-dGTP pyrophosphatase MutT (NUDIX family)